MVVDRKLPCPDAWVDKTQKADDDYVRPIIGRPKNEIKMRVRGTTRAPKQDRLRGKAPRPHNDTRALACVPWPERRCVVRRMQTPIPWYHCAPKANI